jgi:hypothetical protein
MRAISGDVPAAEAEVAQRRSARVQRVARMEVHLV